MLLSLYVDGRACDFAIVFDIIVISILRHGPRQVWVSSQMAELLETLRCGRETSGVP